MRGLPWAVRHLSFGDISSVLAQLLLSGTGSSWPFSCNTVGVGTAVFLNELKTSFEKPLDDALGTGESGAIFGGSRPGSFVVRLMVGDIIFRVDSN